MSPIPPEKTAQIVLDLNSADAELAPLRARVAELEAERLQLHADMNHNWRRFKEAEAKRNEWFEMWKQANVWSWEERDLRVAAEAALARVEALADEWGRDKHRVLVGIETDPRRLGWRTAVEDHEAALRAALAAAGPAVSDGEGATSEAHGPWWDADHDREADVYCPPERAYCKRCGIGRSFADALTCKEPTGAPRLRPASPVVAPSATDEGA